MKYCKSIRKYILLLILTGTVISCTRTDEEGDIIEPANSIGNYFENNLSYSSFNAALEITDIKKRLEGNDHFTVFAPNNAAFNTFLSERGYANLNAVPEEVLNQLVLNHIVEGEINASNLTSGYLTTLSTFAPKFKNLSLYVNVSDHITLNNSSRVIHPNLEVENGVIHAVDAIIALPDVTTFVFADPDLEILASALTRENNFPFMGLLQNPANPAPFTVFAPGNNAFVSLLQELELGSIDELEEDILASILSYHIVLESNLRSEDFINGTEIQTLQSQKFTLNTGTGISITDLNEREINVNFTDIQATNGVIHIIGKVMLPEL